MVFVARETQLLLPSVQEEHTSSGEDADIQLHVQEVKFVLGEFADVETQVQLVANIQ